MAAYQLKTDIPSKPVGIFRRIKRGIRSMFVSPAPAQLSLGPVVTDSKAIGIFDNFLTDEEFRKVQHWALGLPADLTREDRDWSVYIKLDFADCLMSRMWFTGDDDVPPEAQLFIDRIRATDWVEDDAELLLGVYRWQPKSGMGEHSDGHTELAVTFYLNDTWQKNWFGDFIFYESKEAELAGFGRAVAPKANRLVINRHTVPHKVTYTSGLAVERLSIQAFVVKPDAVK